VAKDATSAPAQPAQPAIANAPTKFERPKWAS
jgi:hypothetical protein